MTESARQKQQRAEQRRLRRIQRMVLTGRPLPPGFEPPPTPVSVAEVQRGHLDERLGLFVIIVLGEALAQVIAANTEVEWRLPVVVASVAAFLLLITLWSLTTLYGFSMAPRVSTPLEPWVALPAHLAVTAAVVSMAAGLGALVPEAAEHLDTRERWYLFGGLTLYFAISVVTGLVGRAPLRWFLIWAVPCLLAAVAVALLGEPLPAWSLALVALLLPVWFYAYDGVNWSDKPA
jgi:low temperature requirement protein LtrA